MFADGEFFDERGGIGLQPDGVEEFPRFAFDALVVDEEGCPITSAASAAPGDAVKLRFADGERRARIEGDENG